MTLNELIGTLEEILETTPDNAPVFFVDHDNVMHDIEVYSYKGDYVYIQSED